MSFLAAEATPALFLDRDGVINEDQGYLFRPQDIVFTDGIFALLRTAQDLRVKVVVVTNQSGVARGFYSEDDVRKLHGWMASQFALENLRVAGFYYSPFHPEASVEAYRRVSMCRKPGPGMLLQAAEELQIDLGRSMLVGDNVSDLRAAAAAGLPRALWLGGDASVCSELALSGCDVTVVKTLADVRIQLLALFQI